MPEKRYKVNKYVYCHCLKHEQVMVGTEMYKYLNVFAVIGGVTITLFALFSTLSVFDKLLITCLLGIPLIAVSPYNYQDAKKIMLEAGHSEECSRKIARMAMFRASLWSDKLKIMKDKDDGKRSWR